MRASRWLLLAFWVVPALVATWGMVLVPSRMRPDLGLAEHFGIQLALWLSWGLWSLAIGAVGRRFPFEAGGIGRALAAHLPLYVLVVFTQIVLVTEIGILVGMAERRPLPSMLSIGVRIEGAVFTVIFWGIVAAHAALRWRAALREEQLQNARLDRDLSAAQLRALQSQLRPHFLFNALNSIVSMIERDRTAAQRMLIQLADLLRATLSGGERQEIELDREIELTRLYLEIEQVRFSDRLTVDWEIEPDLRAHVPALGLQPLVENAIVHGIARREGAGRIAISVRGVDSAVEIRVEDNGPGPQESAGERGVGLGNLAARLERLYGPAAGIELAPGAAGGAVATLRIPRSVRESA